MNSIVIPADVPRKMHETFIANYTKITQNTSRLFLFSCDQKIEHLHDDFDPEFTTTSTESSNPEHFFKIAHEGRIGAMATQLELIARYGAPYKTVPYIAKLNSKTNIIPAKSQDPLSAPLWSIDNVMRVKNESQLSICGIGITMYPGSKYEPHMMTFAARAIFQAHQYGLVAILWMYPRGKSVINENDPHLIAGVAGMANALGADFVKIKAPTQLQALPKIVTAAGNTKVIVSGGAQVSREQFLKTLYDQLHNGGIAGAAVGRNIFQHNLPQAVQLTKAIAALIYDNASLAKALEYI